MSASGADYDVVIVGGGVMGAAVARRASAAGLSVLILEAGPGGALDPDTYDSYVDAFRTNPAKATSTGYPTTPAAPYLNVFDLVNPSTPDRRIPADSPETGAYYVENGPLLFRSDYMKMLGGTTLHWQGSSFRMLPNDFRTRTAYNQGIDWPIGYDDLDPYYEDAEAELGVSADVEDQSYLGVTFREGYVYPMKRMPQSYLDTWLSDAMGDLPVTLAGQTYTARCIPLPQARNSEPNPAYNARQGYTPVPAIGDRDAGQRCQGNSSCMPVCPVQAKYSAARSFASLTESPHVTVTTQAVVKRLLVDRTTKEVTAVQFQTYTDPVNPNPVNETVSGRVVVLAGNAIQNAMLMLYSDLDVSDQVGKNLMDHPYLYIIGTAPEPVYPFRGPDTTTGIDSLRDGAFRSTHAAFRMSISNWGWSGSPKSDVQALLGQGLTGQALRDTLGDRLTTQVKLGVMLEQLPQPTNSVTIDGKHVDALGNPRPVLNYDIGSYEMAGAAAAVGVATAIFEAAGITNRTDWTTQADNNVPGYTYVQSLGVWYSIMGAGHIVGTHRMSNSSDSGVTDTNCQVYGVPNLYAVGCGSMVSIGTSNPTLTGVAIAFKAADAIVEALT
jgi:choline dehydrogenase-like flavoprotein